MIKSQTKQISLFYNYKQVASIITDNEFSIVDRADFDNTLKMYYESIGGIFLEETNCNNIDYKNSLVTINDNKKMNYKVLIGAN